MCCIAFSSWPRTLTLLYRHPIYQELLISPLTLYLAINFPSGSGCSSASLSHTTKAGGVSGPLSTRLDFATLGPVVQRLLQAGLAPATQKAYLAGKKETFTILPADWDSTLASDRAGPPAVRGLCS